MTAADARGLVALRQRLRLALDRGVVKFDMAEVRPLLDALDAADALTVRPVPADSSGQNLSLAEHQAMAREIRNVCNEALGAGPLGVGTADVRLPDLVHQALMAVRPVPAPPPALPKICPHPEQCCLELSRVWRALGIAEYNGKSASENVAALRARAADAEAVPREARDAAPPDRPASDEFRREVRDKLLVVFHGKDNTPLQRNIVLKQCEDFLVELHEKALRARAADAGAGPRWEPIETAPKDGTKILVWTPHQHITRYDPSFRVEIVWWRPDPFRGKGEWSWRTARTDSYIDPPTHWQPLPDPPVPTPTPRAGEPPKLTTYRHECPVCKEVTTGSLWPDPSLCNVCANVGHTSRTIVTVEPRAGEGG